MYVFIYLFRWNIHFIIMRRADAETVEFGACEWNVGGIDRKIAAIFDDSDSLEKRPKTDFFGFNCDFDLFRLHENYFDLMPRQLFDDR